MKTAIRKHLLGWPSRAARRFNAIQAFTLIELLVVIATLAVLSVMLLPALAGSRAQPRVTACAANFRQWTVSVNLYANDNLDWLPRFDFPYGGGGMYLWDVPTNFVSGLAPYGLTVPMWFCPVRPEELNSLEKSYGGPIITIEDLEAAFGNNAYSETIIRHNWWVPRTQATTTFPTDYSTLPPVVQPWWIKGTAPALYGWPKRLHDNAAAHVPFISDLAASSTSGMGFVPPGSGHASASPEDCSPNTAHFVNGVLLGVNAAYADGHVESHNKLQMRCGYKNSSADIYWFY